MRRKYVLHATCLSCLLASSLLSTSVAYDIEGGARPMPRSAPRASVARPGVQAQGGGIQKKISRWAKMYVSFVTAAAKVSKWINMGCGMWLLLQTPVAILASTISLNVPDTALCVYLGCFGVMLTGVEIPLGPLKRLFEVYFRFLYTTHGRLGFIILTAAMAWSIKQVGVITKMLVVFNALLSFYVYNSPVEQLYSSEDAAVQEGMKEAATELQRGASDMINLANVFGVGRFFKSNDAPQPSKRVRESSPYTAPPPPYEEPTQSVGSPYAAAGRPTPGSYQPAWPSEDN